MNEIIESSHQLKSLVETARAEFTQRFGHPPQSIAAAPGRVNMIGEHVDYNEGLVLPFAIDRYTLVAGRVATAGRTTTVHSLKQDKPFTVAMDQPITPSAPSWQNYVKGVMHGFVERGVKLPAMEMLIHSNVPSGSGLSSSAALEVATATFLESASGVTLKKLEKALLCQTAEHQFASVPCGIMDQFVSVFGQQDAMLLLDCRDLSMQHVPFADEELTVLVINSNVSHELASSQYSIRRRRCESAAQSLGVESLRDVGWDQLESRQSQLSELEFQRAKHVVTENARTLEFVEQMGQRNWETAGKLLYQSHDSLRDDYEVSCAELDLLVRIASEIGMEGGVYGSRMTGGGFGGCTVTLVARDAAVNVMKKIVHGYNSVQGLQSKLPATAFATRPARGAQLI